MTVREKFRYIEKCLYNYHANMARLEVLRFDLAELHKYGDVHAQDYMRIVGESSIPSNPPAMYEGECTRLEVEIARLE